MSLRDLSLGRRHLPVIRAAEAAECGLACVAMIGSYHGHNLDLNTLRQRFSLSLHGATLRGLMELGGQLSLAPRALRVGLNALDKVQTPAIIHWDLNHFVVLKSVRGNRVTIHDPARGARTMRLDEVSRHFSGVVLELSPVASFRPIEAQSRLRLSHLWSRISGLGPVAAQVLLLSFLFQLVTFVLPFQMQLVVDEAIGRSDRNLLTVLALGFGALVVIHAGLEALRNWVLRLMGALLSFQVVGNIVRHLLRLPVSYFEKRHIGDVMSRIESTMTIQDALTRGTVSALVDGVMAIIAAGVLFLYSPLLAVIVIVSLVIVLALAFAFYPATRARTEERIIALADEQSHLMESVRGAQTIKLFGAETAREAAWRNRYARVINSTVSLGRFEITLGFVQQAVIGLQTVLVVFLGARMILDAQGFSIGMLMAFLSYRQTFSDRTLSLVGEITRFRLLRLHLDRLADIVVTPADAGDTQTALPGEAERGGAVDLRNVNFRYGATMPLVLDNVSLSVAEGEFIAIKGPSGSGKTTLSKILLGLAAPETGQVLLDGQPASPALWRAWRAGIGVVAQDDRLLSGSIADNIAFFDADMDMERVVMAAAAAQVHDDILRMPMQYMTLVGDMGSALSGGQRQRIFLARALYRRPRLLLLDEGTANLDEESERGIANLIEALPITRIVIAHRPELISRASRCLICEGGKLREIRTTPLRDAG